MLTPEPNDSPERGGERAPELRVIDGRAEHNFEDLVRSTYKSSLALALRLVGNLEDASDVIQDAYLKAYRAIGNFRGDSSFETWIYRIVSNTAFSFKARKGKHAEEELTLQVENQDRRGKTSFDDAIAAASSARIDLERALAKLPARLKSVVVLKDVYGLSHREIAEKLSITEATAKVWLHRARKRLIEGVFSDRRQDNDDDGESAAS